MLIDEPAHQLVFGPNSKTVLAAVNDGTTSNELTYVVSNSSGSQSSSPSTIIDSGGVYGTILQSALPGGSLPDGTEIKVYANGTEVYDYVVDSSNAPTVISSGSQNTGYVPFSQRPIYVDYVNNQVAFDTE